MWHKTQRCEFRDDGSLDFHVTVSGLNEICWWILGYGDQAEVLGPVELKQKIVEHCQRLLEQYRQSGVVLSPHLKPPARDSRASVSARKGRKRSQK